MLIDAAVQHHGAPTMEAGIEGVVNRFPDA
jgi:hypothetical protein